MMTSWSVGPASWLGCALCTVMLVELADELDIVDVVDVVVVGKRPDLFAPLVRVDNDVVPLKQPVKNPVRKALPMNL